MKQTWRWFGPSDGVSLNDARQAGASGIVTALHHVPNGAVWDADAINERKQMIEQASLRWDVVESLPVSEDIKRQTGAWKDHISAYKTSIENIAASGVHVICYNFMPVLDWTRTDLGYELPNGAKCMRFDTVDFAAFDLHILQRKGAEDSFSPDLQKQAAERHAEMSDADKTKLTTNILCGLPGAEAGYDLSSLKDQLNAYSAIDADRLRQNHFDFLSEVHETAEKCDVRLCCHPDDPPFSLLGLPRIMSTEADYQALIDAVSSQACGITLCSGSLGVRRSNDLVGMVDRLGSRIHFVHLRNVLRETKGVPNSFHEAGHLEGSTDMAKLVFALLKEEARRKNEGRGDWDIPMRPDHGQDILSDLKSGGQPGYPAVGRLKGLAELRGLMTAFEAMNPVH